MTKAEAKVQSAPLYSHKFTALDYLVLGCVGAICGVLLWFIGKGEVIPDDMSAQFAALVVSFAAGFYLLWRREQIVARLAFIFVQAIFLAALTWLSFWNSGYDDTAAVMFWMLVGGPLMGFLLTAFARASFRQRSLFWPYKALWQSGSSILADMLVAGAVGIAAIGFVALWGVAFESFGMTWAAKITHSAIFLLPLGGAAAGLAAGLARSNARLGEAVRSVLLIGCRIGLPLAALFSLVFAIGLVGGGTASLEKVPLTPAGLLLALALMSELIFNGVYQDGNKVPSRWLRISTWVTLVILPVYTVAAATALWMRVDAYGLTPSRMIALVALTLTAAYTVLLLAGLISEFMARRFTGWMPPVAKLNTGMAFVWILTLVLMQTPLLDPIGVSARNQAGRLISGKADPETFDYGFLRFKLGRPGAQAFEQISELDDPAFQAGIARAKAAENYWNYKNQTGDQDVNEISPETQAVIEVNALLASTGMTMENATQFNYGALAYGHGDAGGKALDALGQWAEETVPDDSGPVRILRARIGQGIVAAQLAKSLAGWQLAHEAAQKSAEEFNLNINSLHWEVGRLGELAGEDRAVRELFEQATQNQDNIPSAEAMLALLYANARVDEMDEKHLIALKSLLGDAPWFDPQKIGKFAEQNAWLIVMHANHDPDFQGKVLKAIEPRALAGEFDGRRYALLYDALARTRGQPQRYGTKLLCEEGRWVADITEYPENLDARRVQIGLPPLAQSLERENIRFGECMN